MAKTLDMKTVTKIVGDKVRDIFKAEVTQILLLDGATNIIHSPYAYFRNYLELEPFLFGMGLTSRVIKARQPLILGTEKEQAKLGAINVTEEMITESYLGVPIIAGEKVLGVVSVQSYQQNAYNENHLRLLQTLSFNMGVAIQNAWLFEAEQERVAELQIINSIQQGLAAELDFQAIVDLVGDKLREVFNTPNLNITWYDEKANLIHYLYLYEHGKRITVEPQPPRPGGIFEALVRTRQPIVINTVEDAKKLNAAIPLPGTAATKSSIEVPIISSDRVLGNIGIDNFERENAFGESELRLLTTIAASLGTALENARLFAETQQRNAELAIINSVQEGLASQLDMQAIYNLVGDKIREIFDTQSLHIRYYDRANNLLHYPYTFDYQGEHLFIESEPITQGLSQFLMETRKPFVANSNVQQRLDEIGSVLLLGQKQYPKSMLAVPTMSGNEATGLIVLGNYDRENAYSESYVSLLATLANSMSVALENARLFDETQRLLKETEQRNAELPIINSHTAGLGRQVGYTGNLQSGRRQDP